MEGALGEIVVEKVADPAEVLPEPQPAPLSNALPRYLLRTTGYEPFNRTIGYEPINKKTGHEPFNRTTGYEP